MVAARGLASRDDAAGSSARWSRVERETRGETKDTMRAGAEGVNADKRRGVREQLAVRSRLGSITFITYLYTYLRGRYLVNE